MSLDGLHFGQVGHADLLKLQRLFVQSIWGSCRGEYEPEQLRVWASGVTNTERWHKAIAEQYFLMAVWEGSPAGFGSITDRGYIDFFYLHPVFQGRGIARRLYLQLEAYGLKNGCNQITSDVSHTARPFFQKMGLKVVQVQQLEKEGILLSNNHMVKSLVPER